MNKLQNSNTLPNSLPHQHVHLQYSSNAQGSCLYVCWALVQVKLTYILQVYSWTRLPQSNGAILTTIGKLVIWIHETLWHNHDNINVARNTLRCRHNGRVGVSYTSLTIVYFTVYSGADQRKHQSSESLAFVQGIHRWPVNSLHKWPVTRKKFQFDDVIISVCIVWNILYMHMGYTVYEVSVEYLEGINVLNYSCF